MKETQSAVSFLNEKVSEELIRDFRGRKPGWVYVGEKKYTIPARYKTDGPMYYNLKVRSDDVWLVSLPRTGSTMTQELTWLLCNDLNFSKAESETLESRFPFLELSLVEDDDCNDNANLSYQLVDKMLSPRLVKTHFPLSLMPNITRSDCKIIYVARNPKDFAISLYHFSKNVTFLDYQGDFEKYWDYFENDLISYTPYWEHVKEAWTRRNEPNFLFLFYEELKYDLLTSLKKVSKFLEKCYTDDDLKKLADHLEFSKFKSNKMVNTALYDTTGNYKTSEFIRQGKAGAWHKMFTPELNDRANQWIAQNLKDTDLKFPHIDIYS